MDPETRYALQERTAAYKVLGDLPIDLACLTDAASHVGGSLAVLRDRVVRASGSSR